MVAIDLTSGMMGVACASCVPNMHGDALAAIVPGKGVAIVQARFTMENRDKVFEMLQVGKSAQEIIKNVSDVEYDSDRNLRQYGIITANENTLEIGTFSGEENKPWYGSQSDEPIIVDYFSPNPPYPGAPGHIISCTGQYDQMPAGEYRWKVKTIIEFDNTTNFDVYGSESTWTYFTVIDPN